MGTRGLYGFRKNDVDKTTYNHYDSYPEGLGKTVVDFVLGTTIEEMNEIYDRLIMVDENDKSTSPTDAELVEWKLTGKVSGNHEDWYSTLRNFQGDLNAYKEGLNYMIDNRDFIKDSVFCEWAYIINLDTNELEVYKGFQEDPSNSRYGNERGNTGFYPCKLIKTFSLDNIPSNWLNSLKLVAV